MSTITTTEAKTYSSPDVEQRVSSVLEEIREVTSKRPWSNPIANGEVNANIPDLVNLGSRLKNALYNTPSRAEVQYRIRPGFLHFPPTEPGQEPSDIAYVVKEPVKYGEPVQPANIIRKTTWPELHKNALPDEVYYRSLMDQATHVMQLFTSSTYSSTPAEIAPTILSNAKQRVEQRRADYIKATLAVQEALKYVDGGWRQVPDQFRDLALGAAGWEAVSSFWEFPMGRDNNWYRTMLGFYLKGMFDIEFQKFEPLREKGSARVGVRAHFLMEGGRIGCWADWEEYVRAFHEPGELSSYPSSCSSYTSYALRFRDKLRLSLHPYPDGDDFNHRPIDRTQ